MIKTIIVDDDHLHLESLDSMIKEHFKQIEIIALCHNITTAVCKIDELKPQLVFLDIEMGTHTGFDLLEMVSQRDFEVIFTTNYQKYAIQAIKASALDFIEKPIRKDHVAEALQRFKAKSGNERMLNLLANFKSDAEYHKIALPDKKGLSFFEVRNIIRCQSDNSYTEFFILENGKQSELVKIEISKGLSYFEDYLLDKGFFYRIHNQHLINVNHIKKYIKCDGGYLMMMDGSTIPVARNRKDDFIHYLQSRGIML
jgi:two-component system, LytTR family, response regulator